MACNWNLNTSDEPAPETSTIVCQCEDCGRYADLQCERDFRTGALSVSVMTCKEKGGGWPTREAA
jgi:hypothetical protein